MIQRQKGGRVASQLGAGCVIQWNTVSSGGLPGSVALPSLSQQSPANYEAGFFCAVGIVLFSVSRR